MPFTIDYLDDGVHVWSKTDAGAVSDRHEQYHPTIYVAGTTQSALGSIHEYLRTLPGVVATDVEQWRRGFRYEPEPVLRLDLDSLSAVQETATTIRGWGEPGEFRLFNVDFSREFRYCLETDSDPTPQAPLTRCTIDVPPHSLGEDHLSLTVDGDPLEGDVLTIAETLKAYVLKRDPDVLVVSTSDLFPVLFEEARLAGRADYQLGRLPGIQQLAGRSTYESYGRVGHSPARYNLPGRVIIDESNAFFWRETNLEGLLDLVGRSRKPLQELAWASIGNVLTAIQIREALSQNVLVPWRAWRPEQFKTMRQLHAADRGGFTFAPEVGVHEDVHELDFSSLYPNIIVTRNVSPETIRCACHEEREDVPELGYAICDERGYLPDVLAPLIADRDAMKRELAETDDAKRKAALDGRSAAIKWILVSCFGYQGFSNAKFGRIECHEAINAYAREIPLTAKERLEAGGWHVVHGIVDSLWVTPSPDREPEPLATLVDAITEEVGIRLEYETAYDWIAFCPFRDSEAGTLTHYFGRRAGVPAKSDEAFKYRGIECRQRSTPPFVAAVQRDLIRTFDRSRSPEAVCDRLRTHLGRLQAGLIPADQLAITTRVSKFREEYTQATRSVAALDRAAQKGIEYSPGQSVTYVVLDDDASGRDRVALIHEDPEEYDVEFYRDLLVRAAESVFSPIGWRRDRISRFLAEYDDKTLDTYR
ncbi:type B DNA-directed DNA polymerase [Halomarina halobia]|uniref:DNA-directed DNA polymerase n=1 Tax=Halomarina halobia TaxID=3033386 RepID=A0ABD6AFH8_9EURY|nr:type B DNA-directed DNA polymerase [Halomarina sp. PSR21]